MAKEITSAGKYAVKETGENVAYDFTFLTFDSIEDAIESALSPAGNKLGEAGVLALIQRMIKVDANNNAREKAKTANGHSARIAMSEEQKAEKKAERAADKALIEAIKANPDLLAQLQG